MTLAAGVLDQDHFAGTDDAALAVTRRDLHPSVQIDDVLAPGRWVPVKVIVAGRLPEDDAGSGELFGEFTEMARFNPFHLDVAEMRLPAGVLEQVVYAHEPT